MNPKVICIISQSHLSNNPRVLKEAVTLADHGYRINILNGIFSDPLLKQDVRQLEGRNISLLPISDLRRKTIRSLADRFCYKLGRLLIRYVGLETPLALGYGSFRYLNAASRLKADLYICHQELAAYTGARLLKKGFRVAFDFEDWYSEDLLENARKERPIRLLRKIESNALRGGLWVVTTSAVMARQLSKTYNCPLPGVIYNVFPSDEVLLKRAKRFKQPLKLLWFSQTVGPGRGIENFIRVLRSVKRSVQLHLLGNIDPAFRARLIASMPRQHELFFHGPVESALLPAKIAEFDVGLALELTSPPSRNYTITNKFFQYLQSGIPLIATKTDGQQEGFEKFRPGILLAQTHSEDEIAELEHWLSDPEALAKGREQAIGAAAFYNWENESKKLIQLVDDIFKNAGQLTN